MEIAYCLHLTLLNLTIEKRVCDVPGINFTITKSRILKLYFIEQSKHIITEERIIATIINTIISDSSY